MEFYFLISNRTNDPVAKPTTPHETMTEAIAAAKKYAANLDLSYGYYIDIFSESPEERIAMAYRGDPPPAPMHSEFVPLN